MSLLKWPSRSGAAWLPTALFCLGASSAWAAAPVAAASAPVRAEKPLPTAPGDYKTTAWKALVPKDWDPSQAFKGLNQIGRAHV